MADFSLDLEGLEQALEEIDEIIDDVDSDATFTVGTGVEYSVPPMPSLNRTNSGKRYVAP